MDPSISATPPHRITTRMRHGIETVSCNDLSASHRTDALRRLCRAMVAAGLSGPAEVCGDDGRLRFTVRGIERAARFTLTETDTHSLRLRPYQEWTGPSAGHVAAQNGGSVSAAPDLLARA